MLRFFRLAFILAFIFFAIVFVAISPGRINAAGCASWWCGNPTYGNVAQEIIVEVARMIPFVFKMVRVRVATIKWLYYLTFQELGSSCSMGCPGGC